MTGFKKHYSEASTLVYTFYNWRIKIISTIYTTRSIYNYIYQLPQPQQPWPNTTTCLPVTILTWSLMSQKRNSECKTVERKTCMIASHNTYHSSNCTTLVCRYGQCIPYQRYIDGRSTPCDRFFTVGVDRVFLPHGRARNDIFQLISFAVDATIATNLLQPPCRYSRIIQ